MTKLSAKQQARAMARAARLVQDGAIGGGGASGRFQTGAALPVVAEDGTMAMIFVPVLAEDRLAGFIQFTPDLTLLRVSSFCPANDDLARCPSARSWTDTGTISDTAQRAAPGLMIDTDPVLSFDGVPDRIAWRVTGTTPDGRPTTVFVAGDSAWPARPSGGGMNPTID